MKLCCDGVEANTVSRYSIRASTSDWEWTEGRLASPWATARARESNKRRCQYQFQYEHDEQAEGTHDEPANGVGPGEPFDRIFGPQTGFGSPLVAEEVEEPEVPKGVHGSGGVWLVLHGG